MNQAAWRATTKMALIAASGWAGGWAAAAAAPPQVNWKAIATEDDRGRIRNWRTAWMQAIGEARSGGHAAQIAGEGILLQPDAALPDPTPPEGDYRCRIIKLGAKAPGAVDFVSYPSFACRVAREGEMLSFTKLDGVQRPCGFLFPGDGQRLIFLGTMMLSDERKALDYGRDRQRDMAGAFERIGDRRWRLVLPYPQWDSTLDVVEVVPAG